MKRKISVTISIIIIVSNLAGYFCQFNISVHRQSFFLYVILAFNNEWGESISCKIYRINKFSEIWKWEVQDWMNPF